VLSGKFEARRSGATPDTNACIWTYAAIMRGKGHFICKPGVEFFASVLGGLGWCGRGWGLDIGFRRFRGEPIPRPVGVFRDRSFWTAGFFVPIEVLSFPGPQEQGILRLRSGRAPSVRFLGRRDRGRPPKPALNPTSDQRVVSNDLASRKPVKKFSVLGPLFSLNAARKSLPSA